LSTIACIATGPSLSLEQIQSARNKGFRLFGCNNVYRVAPDLELLYACNLNWWETYWAEVSKLPFEKWTTNAEAANTYRLNWIAERDGLGLCEESNVIHHGHGSGFSLVSMAHKKGASRIVLLGYDLHYSTDYNGRARYPGSTPRHSTLLLPTGEYPKELQHWPSVAVKDGVHHHLVKLYDLVQQQGLVELINCTPGSALEPVLGYVPIDAL